MAARAAAAWSSGSGAPFLPAKATSEARAWIGRGWQRHARRCASEGRESGGTRAASVCGPTWRQGGASSRSMTTHDEAAAKTRHIESNLSCQATLLVGRPPTPPRYLWQSVANRGRTGICALSSKVDRACTWVDDSLPRKRPRGLLAEPHRASRKHLSAGEARRLNRVCRGCMSREGCGARRWCERNRSGLHAAARDERASIARTDSTSSVFFHDVSAKARGGALNSGEGLAGAASQRGGSAEAPLKY